MGSDYWTTIGHISEVFDGPHATPKKIEHGPYFLSISSLNNGKLDLSKSARLSEDEFIKWTKRVTPREGDVLFSYETRLGDAALMPNGIRACLGRRMGLLRPDTNRVVPRYLLYAYLSPEFQAEIRSRTNSGATVDRIALKEFPNFPIQIPPLPEQRAIAHILGSLDDKIELNRRMNETLEAMAQAMFKSWFVDFDPVIDNALAAGNEIPETLKEKAAARKSLGDARKPLPEEIRNLFPSEFEYSDEMGWIPKGWEVGNVGDVLERLKVKRRYKKKDVTDYGLIPVYEQGSNILMGYHNGLAEVTASKDDPAFIFGDHTCVTKLSCESFSISENVIPLKGKLFSTYWVYYAIKDKQSFEEYRRHWMELIVKKIVLPAKNIAENYENLIIEKIVKQNFLSHQIVALSNLRDTLLPKLLSGEIRIPEKGEV